jgi:signal transduction histidine kinase/ActR/RegA family two-component response regulator
MQAAIRFATSRYGFALVAVSVAVLLRLLLDPLVHDGLPFLLACIAVVAAAWHGGFGPSMLALVLGITTTAYLFLPPRYSLLASLDAHRVWLAGFAFLGVITGLFSARVRAAWRRAEALAREAVARQTDLELEVGERRRLEEELQQRNEELAEADRRKDEFLAMLGHELRNPLAPIRNALELLQELGPAEPQLRDAHAMIERQLDHLTRLVEDLLDVARITRGKILLRSEPIRLAAVLQGAIESTRPLIEANRHALNVSLLPEPIWVSADPTRLEQVFANLLNNATKYTERGGSIEVIEEEDNGAVRVRVRDTGFGIPVTMLPHVFDLFTQADRTLDRAQGGLGIGLTLVKTLVELHGGTVAAHSDGPGQGSEFVVRLPIVAQPPEPVRAEPPIPATRSADAMPLHVLVVEDNRDAADSLAMLLRLWGHEVRTSHDGHSGLKAAQSYRPHVVLLDIGLPGLDGYEVARQLRAQFGSAMRLVAMTGYGQEEDRRRAFEAGFNAHLVKPADPEVLQSVLALPESVSAPV